MTVQVETQKPIRTTTLKLLVGHGISVARFRANAKRTRLRDESNLLIVQKHIALWGKYGWL